METKKFFSALFWIALLFLISCSRFKKDQKVTVELAHNTFVLLGFDKKIEDNLIDAAMFFRLAEEKNKVLASNPSYLQKKKSFIDSKAMLKAENSEKIQNYIQTQFTKGELEDLNTFLKKPVNIKLQAFLKSKKFNEPAEQTFATVRKIIIDGQANVPTK